MKCPKDNKGCPYNKDGECHCPCRTCEVKDKTTPKA